MEERILRLTRSLMPLGSLFFAASLMLAPILLFQGAHATQGKATANIGNDQAAPTADQKKMNSADRALTQQIRKAIHHDRSLSASAKNIKILTQNGKVTLRGPVRSDAEKGNLEAKAATAAGPGNVTNQLEVKASK